MFTLVEYTPGQALFYVKYVITVQSNLVSHVFCHNSTLIGSHTDVD